MMSMLEDDRDIGWRAEDFNPRRRAAKRFSVEELQQEGFSVSQKASLDLLHTTSSSLLPNWLRGLELCGSAEGNWGVPRSVRGGSVKSI